MRGILNINNIRRSITLPTLAIFAAGVGERYDDKEAKQDAKSSMDLGLAKWASVGLPGGDTHYVFRDNLAICIDNRTRNPKWVMERVSTETVTGDADRKVLQFYEEPSLDRRFRAKNSDYMMSGYDRGHLAPAADYRSSPAAMKETFSLANISPQVGAGFNRDYWARFEKFVRDLTKTCSLVYIVSGPLYLPRRRMPNEGSSHSRAKFVMNYELLGDAPDLVAVPTHFFKVVLAEMSNGRCLVSAFVLPNAAIDPTVPLTSFVVPLDNLERAAGLRFFAQYLSNDRRALLDACVPGLQAGGGSNPTIAGLLTDGSTGSNAKQGGAIISRGGGSLRINLDGPEHLCEVMQCQLPPEGFWEKAASNLEGKGKGGGKGNGEGSPPPSLPPPPSSGGKGFW